MAAFGSVEPRRPVSGRRLARRALMLGACVLPLTACYTFVPVENGASPVVGERYALHISDQGRVSLAQRFGPGLSQVEGRMTQVTPQEFALNVFKVEHFGNQRSTWAGEDVRIDRGHVGRIDFRKFSRKRTWIAAGVTTAALGYFMLSRGLLGFYTGDTPEPTMPPPEQAVGLSRIAR